MLYIERWKVYLIVIVVSLGVLYALPNVLGKQTVSWMQANLPSFMPVQTVSLGLDLRGGSHLLLEVETDAVVTDQLQMTLDQVRKDLRKANVRYTGLALSGKGLRFTLLDASDADKAKAVLREIDKEMELDVSGTAVTARMTDKAIAEKKRLAMDQSIEIVRRRIDESGTREPSIQRQGEDRILVQLPGVDNPEQIKNLLGQTAKLSFRLVDEAASMEENPRARPGFEKMPSVEEGGRSWIVEKRALVSGDSLVDAQPSFQMSDAVVSFRFDSLGGRRFGEATRANVGRLFAIVLDGKVISAPVIREPITGGSGVISGNFTVQSASDLALLLRAGALPAPIKVIEERTVGPGLGTDSINAGMTACVIGMGAVMIFVLLTYGLFGVFANIALLLNVVLLFAVLSMFQATLTLPGIAGIVLTIGMAVDANVLIFERIREEVRMGRTPLSALDAGFDRAFPAIMDANVTSLIASLLLFTFGTGPIKGFAVTLTVGLLTSMFTAILVVRLLISIWTRVAKPKEIPI